MTDVDAPMPTCLVSRCDDVTLRLSRHHLMNAD